MPLPALPASNSSLGFGISWEHPHIPFIRTPAVRCLACLTYIPPKMKSSVIPLDKESWSASFLA